MSIPKAQQTIDPHQLRLIEEQQRHLLALDLHDDIGQLLTAILINLKKLGETAPPPADRHRCLSETRKLVENIFYSIRNFTRGVSPSNGLLPDLYAALTALTEDLSTRTAITVSASGTADLESLPLMHKAVIYRIVQESLTNVVRHSAATRVSIGIRTAGDGVTVSISDDGAAGGPAGDGVSVGADGGNGAAAFRLRGGTGIAGLRDRVRLIGGEFSAEMVEGEGMAVRAVLPLNHYREKS